MEQRLQALGISLPSPPVPLGRYAETAQTGRLLFLSGTLPLDGAAAIYRGRIGVDLSIDEGRNAARLATLNSLALLRQRLGSLDPVDQVVRLKVSLATSSDFRDHAIVADGASELLADVFGTDKASTRMVAGAYTLPLGVCVVVELIVSLK